MVKKEVKQKERSDKNERDELKKSEKENKAEILH